ncbi:hypothetical protein KFZ58_07055 [Virgibacillus sp. NKC19-16]|uniref:hypothetical protein n=1 Tax=Virgibacillus salidurans TaxID=2831673 RepID=UPI001F17537F|nr:hypothetical protein [Virgibacillus sp. NKC19-16]UJL47616.1 hypothetical protein KFZ58_07055 [Virgibacillus sp. NKC19-16]
MSILVDNCNHWIGFHIVDELLENSYTVDGIGDEDSVLAMFLGRNSSFNFVKPDVKKHYDTAIIIGDQSNTGIKSGQSLIINPVLVDRVENRVEINVPLLFGEWMPMNEKGFYYNNTFITFDSDFFQTEAIYIKDFTKGLMQWLKMKELPSTLEVRSEKNKDNQHVKLENAVYIRDNRPMEEKVKSVLEHYYLYKKFYK